MHLRRVGKATAVLVAAAALLVASCTSQPTANSSSSRRTQASHQPTGGVVPDYPPLVRRTGTPPTGYAVTFRYWGPTATEMELTGEWSFSSPLHTTTTSSQTLAPAQWGPGDFPIVHPNTLDGTWPVTAMTKDARTGVWSATLPLPSGVFTYGFLVNCPASTGTGHCTEVPDPSNPPWNTRAGTTTGSVETDSEVFVPSDGAFMTVNYSWQATNSVHGALVDVAYPSSAAKQAAKADRLTIYTPPGYNPKRSLSYPTLYLSHGYGGNEFDWSTTGDASNILDNLIDSGQVKPLVVVMTDFNGFPDTCLSNGPAWTAEYDRDLISNVIPFVQTHYDISRQASARAFAGLSCGGGLATSLFFSHTGEFGYYGVLSPYQIGWAGLTPAQIKQTVVPYIVARRPALDKVGLFLGGGRQDPIHSTAAAELAILEKSGITVNPDFINGGHEWYVWRILLHDFLTRTAFLPVAR